MIDMDMGEEDIVEPLHPITPQFAHQERYGRQRAGIDEQVEIIPAVEP